MTVIIWTARRVQDLIEWVLDTLFAPIEVALSALAPIVALGLGVAVCVGGPLGVLYLIIRFIKWAWMD